MGTLRASAVLATFFTVTLPLMPLQAVLVRVAPKSARRFPHWYHRNVCRILGISLQVDGAVASDRPVLLVANHSSWLDIPVLSAVAPVSFVAKREVGGWPFVASLARLQRTVFVDRTRRLATGDAADAITARLAAGDTIVLFAEGTSSDGNRVLPFKSSLFGAVKARASSADPHIDTDLAASEPDNEPVVQTIAVVYTHRRGLPLSRAERSTVAWYGDMDLHTHAWSVLRSGPLTATIRVGSPVRLSDFVDRKEMALKSEREVRRAVHSILRGRALDGGIETVEPAGEARRLARHMPSVASEKWT